MAIKASSTKTPSPCHLMKSAILRDQKFIDTKAVGMYGQCKSMHMSMYDDRSVTRSYTIPINTMYDRRLSGEIARDRGEDEYTNENESKLT